MRENEVIVGSKEVINYLLAIFWKIFIEGYEDIIITAAGKNISKAKYVAGIYSTIFGYLSNITYGIYGIYPAVEIILKPSKEKRREDTPLIGENIVWVGRKPKLNYLFAIFWKIFGQKFDKVIIKAAGTKMQKAIDIANAYNEKFGFEYTYSHGTWKGNPSIEITLTRSLHLESDILEEEQALGKKELKDTERIKIGKRFKEVLYFKPSEFGIIVYPKRIPKNMISKKLRWIIG
jgi:DNA-binding protein